MASDLKATSYRLSPQTLSLLEEMHKQHGTPRVRLIETALERYADRYLERRRRMKKKNSQKTT